MYGPFKNNEQGVGLISTVVTLYYQARTYFTHNHAR